ncbi:universal stress protein [Streptomyces sp. WMMC940]|uniref:universal stress protein n=1 Tax=Streptomyces sp. WMMC940 TaxID=3015153 RepID=UPI0022B74E5B|nr:universal stress protein [Streptomyces sp. WMMC940]MCZ7462020.1 universal stress protein [Streptomyces sp. WMMC940]
MDARAGNDGAGNDVTGNREVIVGLDPRDRSRAAISWAAEEAALRGLPLRLVVAVPWLVDTQHVDAEPQRVSLRAQAGRVLESAAAWATDEYALPELVTEVYDGSPVAALTAGSRHAQSVVVGSRGLNRLEEVLSAGSVVVPLTARARCPVVVVREPPAGRARPRLVVGVDARSPSAAALGFAFDEAAVRGVALDAVSVSEPPVLPFTRRERARERQRGLLAETVAEWSGRCPGVAVAEEVVSGDPLQELVRASTSAVAVVVGRSHRRAGTGNRVGRVVRGLLHRAGCPVVVVPPQ